tara:strand:+ start:279 stop:500 length:222 start_codon:yes stop_codon:yes gene_type:complete
MEAPKRETRRRIAYWTMGLITAVVVRALFFPDLPAQAAALLMVTVPSLMAIIGIFIGGEAYGDSHVQKKGIVK